MKNIKIWIKKYWVILLLALGVIGEIVGGILSYCCSNKIGDMGTWYSGIGTILAVVVALTAQNETRKKFQEEHTAKLKILNTYRIKKIQILMKYYKLFQ
ncbi:hypothetical protein [Lactobacillus sp. PV012]|uniref:hypothetical protein n=1 Tax=Lactobacillus sp. PV012 TaxID=2594494 RepID=UPI00223ED037|nr:hypothetical protein [Lactobacillus sp. PV012]QNQ82761.1 hypothetical protein FP433_06795 [Lactobacillus sp. PV012]